MSRESEEAKFFAIAETIEELLEKDFLKYMVRRRAIDDVLDKQHPYDPEEAAEVEEAEQASDTAKKIFFSLLENALADLKKGNPQKIKELHEYATKMHRIAREGGDEEQTQYEQEILTAGWLSDQALTQWAKVLLNT